MHMSTFLLNSTCSGARSYLKCHKPSSPQTHASWVHSSCTQYEVWCVPLRSAPLGSCAGAPQNTPPPETWKCRAGGSKESVSVLEPSNFQPENFMSLLRNDQNRTRAAGVPRRQTGPRGIYTHIYFGKSAKQQKNIRAMYACSRQAKACCGSFIGFIY